MSIRQVLYHLATSPGLAKLFRLVLTHFVAHTDLKPMILLPQPSEYQVTGCIDITVNKCPLYAK